MNRVRVMIVDDHAIVVEALERILCANSAIEVIGRARSLSEFRPMIQQATPDIVILDLRLPDSQGVDTINAVRGMCPTARIVVFTGSADVNEARARRSGADAFLDKQTASSFILSTVLSLAAVDSGVRPPEQPLSARELEVARLVAEGLTNSQIADALFVSENTIKTHLSHILAKLRMPRRVDIARLWNARGAPPIQPANPDHPKE
ncbi:MAG: hypothetical protein DCC65_18575 [Planctomycetota bacterium]|nr:MAG: hypothetical protein DCC65_18575 [Planctomycetota bacterium]